MSKEPQITHWPDCATDGGPAHYACAVLRIRELEQRLKRDAERDGNGSVPHYWAGADGRLWQRLNGVESFGYFRRIGGFAVQGTHEKDRST